MAWWNFFQKNDTKIVPTKGKITLPHMPLMRLRQDAETRREAIAEMEAGMFPFRTKIQRLYLNTIENGYVSACINKRKDLTLLRKWEFVDQNGNNVPSVQALFCDITRNGISNKLWFNNLLNYVLDAQFFGYSLIYLGDIVNNEFVGTSVYKRGNISPDRMILSDYEGVLFGTEFLKDPYRLTNLWVSTNDKYGQSNCGYGLLFEVSIYEILLRNLLGFNGDYIEVNIAPFRQIKTVKTNEDEREALFQEALNMASNGVALTDPTDEIIFHQTGNWNGHMAYASFEERLEAKIAQIILGHADSMASIPGKLGNDNTDSPAQKAMLDKQSIDGVFVTGIINKLLIPKMRELGFSIPEGVTAMMVNDNEKNEIINRVTKLAIMMHSAGLQMDGGFFTEQTGIPLMDIVHNNNKGVDAKSGSLAV